MDTWDGGATPSALVDRGQMIKVPKSGHWVHHDQLDLFLKETTEFLQE